MALDSRLREAQETMEKAQTVRPEQSEFEAMLAFCKAEVRRRTETAATVDTLKGLRQRQKTLKDDLMRAVQGPKCLCLSKADATRLEQLTAADGLPQVPPYLRLLQANKDSTITSEVLQEALESITPEDLKEAASEGPTKSLNDVVRTAVLNNVRRLIRSYTQSVRLVTSLPKGQTVYETQECPTAVADTMLASWRVEQQIKACLAEKKPDPAFTAAQEVHKTKIETFFVRTGLTAQRVIIDSKPFRLVRRMSVRKPKVGIGKLEKILDDVLSRQTLTVFRPSELMKALQVEISSIPPDTKTSVSLCAVKATEAPTA